MGSFFTSLDKLMVLGEINKQRCCIKMWLIQYPVCFPLGKISQRKSPNRQANLHNPLLIIWHPFSANEKCWFGSVISFSAAARERRRKRQLLVMTIKNLRSWQHWEPRSLEITCRVRRCVRNHRRRSRSENPCKTYYYISTPSSCGESRSWNTS